MRLLFLQSNFGIPKIKISFQGLIKAIEHIIYQYLKSKLTYYGALKHPVFREFIKIPESCVEFTFTSERDPK
jgi:hypothetical protein